MKTVTLETVLVETADCEDQVLSVQQLRYQVYANEMQMNLPGIDHAAGVFVDPLDSAGAHLLARSGPLVVGAVRLNLNEVPLGMEGTLEARLLPKPFVYCSRLCILPEWRGGSVVRDLINAAFRKFDELDAEVAICHCYGHLTRLYMRCGFRPYSAPFIVSGLEHLGAQIPMICSLTQPSVQRAA